MRMASKLSLMLRGRPAAAEHASLNGRLVSYGFGAFFAAGYGALTAVMPPATAWHLGRLSGSRAMGSPLPCSA